jgi:hypothetical protein
LISVTVDASAALRMLRNQRDQVPFAIARALTKTAQAGQGAATGAINTVFDRPTPFTQRGVRILPARKTDLEARVFLQDVQARYLGLQIAGGTRKPKKRALVLPTELKTNRYGNIAQGAIKRLLARKDTFSGSIRGVGGIWQRTKGGRLKLLIAYEDEAKYEKRFDFAGVVMRRVRQVFASELSSSVTLAMRTAR